MLVSESNITLPLEDVYILDCGIFYFFENLIISEIKEGILFNWEVAKDVIEIAESHYGKGTKVAYISNRVHNYSLVPQDWLKYFKARDSISAFGVVSYSRQERSNILIEKLFFKSKIRKFFSLEKAVDWAIEMQKEHLKKKTNV